MQPLFLPVCTSSWTGVAAACHRRRHLADRRYLAHGTASVARELLGQREPVEKFVADTARLYRRQRARRPSQRRSYRRSFVNSHRWLERLVSDEVVVLLTVKRVARPYVPEDQRVTIDEISERFVRIRATSLHGDAKIGTDSQRVRRRELEHRQGYDVVRLRQSRHRR